MDDSESWRGLGKRLFDIYIQVLTLSYKLEYVQNFYINDKKNG